MDTQWVCFVFADCLSPRDGDTLSWSSPRSPGTPPSDTDDRQASAATRASAARPLSPAPPPFQSTGSDSDPGEEPPMVYHIQPVAENRQACRPIRPEPERPQVRYHPYAALVAAQNPSPALERQMYRLLPRSLAEPSHLQLNHQGCMASKNAFSISPSRHQAGHAPHHDLGGIEDNNTSPEQGREALEAFSAALKQHRLGLSRHDSLQTVQGLSSSTKHKMSLPVTTTEDVNMRCLPVSGVSPSQYHQRVMFANALATHRDNVHEDMVRPLPRPGMLSDSPPLARSLKPTSVRPPHLAFSLPPVSYYKTPLKPSPNKDHMPSGIHSRDPSKPEDLSPKARHQTQTEAKYSDENSDSPLKVIHNLDTNVSEQHSKPSPQRPTSAHAPLSPGNENRPARPIHPKMALLDRYRQGEMRKDEDMPPPGPPRGVPLQDLSRHQTSLYRVDITRIPRAGPELCLEEQDTLPRGDPPRFRCADCNKTYATYSGLTKHRQFHCTSHVKKEFVCKYCNKLYLSIGALKMHIRTHTLPCKCPLCGKAFSRPWLLQGHIRTHTGEKPFKCQHCARAFADRSNLRAHLQTHQEIKKYSCKACSRTFSRMSLLVKHEDSGCATVMVQWLTQCHRREVASRNRLPAAHGVLSHHSCW